MKLTISRDWCRWLEAQFLPDYILMCRRQADLHPTDSEGYWCRITVQAVVCRTLIHVQRKLINTSAANVTLSLEDDQVFALYKGLLHHCIAADVHVWANLMRNKTIAALHQKILNPDRVNDIFRIE